jgi:hypothetical protein
MTYIVHWYGDLPHKAAWFLKRETPGWSAALVAALGAAGLAFCLLLQERIRDSSVGVKSAAALSLVAVVLHYAWLIAPAFASPDGALLTGAAFFIALTLGTSIAAALLRPMPDRRWAQVDTMRDLGDLTSEEGPPVFSRRPFRSRVHGLIAALRALGARERPARRQVQPASGPAGEDETPPEPAGISSRPVLGTTFGFLAFVAVAVIALGFYIGDQNADGRARQRSSFPAPRLEFGARSELARANLQQRQRLAGYAWVDRDHELVRIPIDRAVRLVIARGAHAFDPVNEAQTGPSYGSGGSAPSHAGKGSSQP